MAACVAHPSSRGTARYLHSYHAVARFFRPATVVVVPATPPQKSARCEPQFAAPGERSLACGRPFGGECAPVGGLWVACVALCAPPPPPSRGGAEGSGGVAQSVHCMSWPPLTGLGAARTPLWAPLWTSNWHWTSHQQLAPLPADCCQRTMPFGNPQQGGRRPEARGPKGLLQGLPGSALPHTRANGRGQWPCRKPITTLL